MTRPTASAAISPIMTDAILSPRRARTAFEQPGPAPFLVDRREPTRAAASETDVVADSAQGGVRIVLRGMARRPILTAWIAALTGMTAIGLFLGLMLGDLAAGG